MEIAKDIDCGGGGLDVYSQAGSETRSRSTTTYSRRTGHTLSADVESTVDARPHPGRGPRSLYTALAEEALLGAAVPHDPEGAFVPGSPRQALPAELRRGAPSASAWPLVEGCGASQLAGVLPARCVVGFEDWDRLRPKSWASIAACIVVLLVPVAVWDLRVLLSQRGGGVRHSLAMHHGCCTFAAAACFACMAGVSVDEFCFSEGARRGLVGCEGRPCCTDPRAECLACTAGLAVSQFCADSVHSSVVGCEQEKCGLVEQGYEYVGGDLYSVGHVLSLDDCCSLCQEEDRCTSWSWAGTRCFLKRQAELRVTPSRGYTSGLPGPDTVEFHIKSRRGTCLAEAGGLLGLQDCDSTASGQHWIFERRLGRLKTALGGRCLEGSEVAEGAVSARACAAERPTQRWRYESESGELRVMHGDWCVHISGGPSEAPRVTMQQCPASTSSREWGLWSSALLNEGSAEKAMRTKPSSSASLFCFSVVASWSHEPALVRMQARSGKSIFACDGFAVYSDRAMTFGGVTSRVVGGTDLRCYHTGGEFNTLVSTGVFIQVWKQVIADGLYAPYEWTAKADPDAVFFPSRLRAMLLAGVSSGGTAVGSGVFLNNCGFGLLGPLEVVSRRAIEAYASGAEACEQPPQESAYLHACMLRLGAEQVNQFSLLSEAACRTPNWQACQSQHVAFHPFKSVDAYLACELRADEAARLVPF